MAMSSYYLAIIIGLTLSLLVEIKLGISPGGLIVPAYLAMILDRPQVVLNVVLISVLSYLVVRYIVSKFVMVYGKRRFVACVLVALLMKFLLSLLYPILPFSVLAFNGIGVVTGGILANNYFKQGIPLTVGSALAVSGVTYLLMNLVSMI